SLDYLTKEIRAKHSTFLHLQAQKRRTPTRPLQKSYVIKRNNPSHLQNKCERLDFIICSYDNNSVRRNCLSFKTAAKAADLQKAVIP
ncbi:hypothetical protein, partial [Phascolarctobacterium succinatutens]|uniref:hypothetical protein n=1 Tax=Phascolarctobacterium succinatutens TaxID=626940 RepID=UPI00402964AB